MYNLKIRMSNLGKDTEIEIPGLGVFKNNTTNFISEDAAKMYVVMGSRNDTSYDENGQLHITVVDGPDLPTVFANVQGITVTAAKVSEPVKNEGGE